MFLGSHYYLIYEKGIEIRPIGYYNNRSSPLIIKHVVISARSNYTLTSLSK